MNETHAFETETTRFDVTLTDQGELEVYASDGNIWVHPRSGNVVTIRAELSWADKTMVDITENAITAMVRDGDNPRDVAQWIFDLIRGRRRKSNYRKDHS